MNRIVVAAIGAAPAAAAVAASADAAWAWAGAAGAAAAAAAPLGWGRAPPGAADPFPRAMRGALLVLAAAGVLTLGLAVAALGGPAWPAPPGARLAVGAGAALLGLLAALGRLEPAGGPLLATGAGLVWAAGGLALAGRSPGPGAWPQLELGLALGLGQGWLLLAADLERWRRRADSAPRARAASALSAALGVGCLATAGAAEAAAAAAASALAALLLVPALTGAALRFRGPSGVPDWRHLLTAVWAVETIVLPAVWFLWVRRWLVPRAERPAAARAAIHRIMRRVEGGVPIGHRATLEPERAAERLGEPSIVVANHGSLHDIVTLGAQPASLVFLVKAWLWRAPVMGPMLREAGYLDVGAPPEVLQAGVRDALAGGASVVIFPEGVRSQTGTIGRFRNGAFALARALGAPVTPVALVGSHEAVPRNTWWVGDHDTRTVILDRLDPAEYEGDLADRRMARAARARIEAAWRERWPETRRGRGWWRPLAGMYRYLGPVVTHYAEAKVRADPLVFALPELVPPGEGPILVAGCGYGLMTLRLALAAPWRSVVAVDLDARKVDVAQAAYGTDRNVRFEVGDLMTCALEGPFAAVVCVDLVHYWEPAAQGALVERLAGALAPGGAFVFRDGVRDASGHAGTARGERLARALGFTQAGTGLHFQDEAGYRGALAAAGLIVEAARPDLGRGSDLVLLARRAGGAEPPA